MTLDQPNRLAGGGLVDRGRPLRFTFDDRALTGYAGDTLASALIANGVRLVGRSFKYHRPRGIFTAGSEEPNALVELRTGAAREPNTKATTVELFDGLEALSQNRWPSLGFDVLSVNGLLSPFLAAGFYYKTFMWPRAFWEKVYEPLIRRAAGLGRAAGIEDPDTYERSWAFCDVLVVGAGPAGLAAALAAGRSGARVILCEEDFRVGGRLLSESVEVDGRPAHAWAEQAAAELASLPEVRLLRRTTVLGATDGHTYWAIEHVGEHAPRQRMWRIVAKRIVLASGALERSIAFSGNDKPGIMLASAARTYINRFAAAPGRRIAVFTCCDDGWRTAADAVRAGLDVAALIDARDTVADDVRAHAKAFPVTLGGRVMEACGGQTLRRLTIADRKGRHELDVDALSVSGGWNPNVALTAHHGARPRWDEPLAAFVPAGAPEGMIVAGAARGQMTLAACLRDGAAAGSKIAADLGFTPKDARLPKADDEPAALTPIWHVGGGRGMAFLDLQNDVTVKDIHLAEREGYRSVEHLKRYTTLGMATDQGKTAATTALGVLAEARGISIEAVGTTRFRPPYVPVAIGALAGPHRGREFRPTRYAPTHAWSQELGAVFVEAGAWLRAQYYPRPGESDWLETVDREVLAVRRSVGICDVSTLGKIDVQGPDAGVFLDRLYINTFSTLPVGKARYGVMLREDGFVMDDGTTSRFAPDRYFMTTTTANAVRVYQHMQFCHQVLWPELDVQFVSVSDQWAQMSVAGPNARATLAGILDSGFDVSNAGLPYLGVADVTVMGGTTARLFRISFSGELAYEIAVPARYGIALARALMEAGAEFGITPYGTEALGVMRIEKGHVAGNELDGRTTASDLGLGRMLSTRKDYIGRVLAARPALVEPGRMQLVGVKPVEKSQRLRAGALLLPRHVRPEARHDQGLLTSVAHSPELGHWVALGLLKGGLARVGERLRAWDPVRHGDCEVEVAHPCFIDPEGARLHV